MITTSKRVTGPKSIKENDMADKLARKVPETNPAAPESLLYELQNICIKVNKENGYLIWNNNTAIKKSKLMLVGPTSSVTESFLILSRKIHEYRLPWFESLYPSAKLSNKNLFLLGELLGCFAPNTESIVRYTKGGGNQIGPFGPLVAYS